MWKKKTPNDFQPTSTRQRRLIIGLTLIAFVVMWVLLIWEPGNDPQTRYPTLYEPRKDLPTCAPGQTTGCVGGQANVMLLPGSAAPAASAPSAP
jgi:hypothetical protein